MPVQKSLLDYEERYKKVYEAGGMFWNEHVPCQRLLDFITRLPEGAKCIDFGCGEGHEARALAKLGFRVTGIDISPIVIQRDKEITHPDVSIEFLVGDVTDLQTIGIADGIFDLALDIGCLHMMNEPKDRIAHLKEIKRTLKPGGFLYLQNGLSLDDTKPTTIEEVEKLHELRNFISKHNSKEIISRRVMTNKGEKEIMIPILPNKLLSLEDYISELTSLGFSVLFSERSGGANMNFEAIIIAKS